MIRNAATVLVLLLVALPACTDASGPDERRIGLILTAHESLAAYGTRDGAPEIECQVRTLVRAEGDPGMTADLTSMVFHFHLGSPESPPLDSVVLSASEVVRAFGGGLRPREEREATWRMVAGTPFSLTIDVRYRTSAGEDASVSADFRCGIGPAPDAPLPVVRIAPLATNPSEPEPGDRLRFAVEAESEIGLWDAEVRVEGAMVQAHRWSGEAARILRDTIIVDVPGGARLGMEIRAVATARDLALRAAESQSASTPPIVDRTPPSIALVGVHGTGHPRFQGQFPEDAPPPLVVIAQDNGQVAWVVFSGGTPGRDSLPYAARDGTYPLPVERARAGDLRVQLRDAAGNLSEPVVEGEEALLFYPRRRAAVRRVPLPEYVAATAIGPSDDRVYVLGHGRDRVHVAALGSALLEATIALEHPAAAIDVSDDGRHLLVSRSDGSALDLIELAAPDRRRSIPLWVAGASLQPGEMKAGAGGKAFMLASAGSAVRIVEVDLADGSVEVAVDAGVMHSSISITRSGDFRRLVVSGVCLFDALSRALDCDRSRAGLPARGDHTGSRWAYRMDVYDDELRRLPLRVSSDMSFQLFAALSPDGSYIFTSSDHGIVRARTTDGLVEDAFLPVGSKFADISVVEDGRRVVLYEDEGLAIYDLP